MSADVRYRIPRRGTAADGLHTPPLDQRSSATPAESPRDLHFPEHTPELVTVAVTSDPESPRNRPTNDADSLGVEPDPRPPMCERLERIMTEDQTPVREEPRPPGGGPTLSERAAAARALAQAIATPCPFHQHAVAEVPCTPPSPDYRRGRVCASRIAAAQGYRLEPATELRQEIGRRRAAAREAAPTPAPAAIVPQAGAEHVMHAHHLTDEGVRVLGVGAIPPGLIESIERARQAAGGAS